MLATNTFFRPKRSVNQPPSSPKTPPQSAVIQSMLPTHCVTSGLFGGTCNISAKAGPAISGSMSSSYVSKAKPITATRITSQPVRPNLELCGGSDATAGELMGQIYGIDQGNSTRSL